MPQVAPSIRPEYHNRVPSMSRPASTVHPSLKRARVVSIEARHSCLPGTAGLSCALAHTGGNGCTLQQEIGMRLVALERVLAERTDPFAMATFREVRIAELAHHGRDFIADQWINVRAQVGQYIRERALQMG